MRGWPKGFVPRQCLSFEGKANDACVEFCYTHDLISVLRECLSEAKTVFSSKNNISAEYDCFPADEYKEDGHIAIIVEVSSDQNTAFQEYESYLDWMLDNVSDENLNFFIVTIHRT